MTGPPAARLAFQAAPPSKRANPDGIPVRLYDGSLIAHISQELADRLVMAGDAETCRRGPRRVSALAAGNQHSAHRAGLGHYRIPPQVAW